MAKQVPENHRVAVYCTFNETKQLLELAHNEFNVVAIRFINKGCNRLEAERINELATLN